MKNEENGAQGKTSFFTGKNQSSVTFLTIAQVDREKIFFPEN